jgi:hypothetical protein
MMFRDFIWHAYDETDNIRLLRIVYTVNTNSLLLIQERKTEGTHADSHNIRHLIFPSCNQARLDEDTIHDTVTKITCSIHPIILDVI